jgi:hypothetical protein
MARIKVIACEVLHRELCQCAARSINIVDLGFLTQGLHDIESEEMCKRLQEHVDQVSGGQVTPERGVEGNWVGHQRKAVAYDAVALGFALCSNGIVGLTAGEVPLVIPRAHDCITLLLGSKERYREMFDDHPGTYFLSTGWRERDAVNLEALEETEMSKMGLDKTYDEYVAKYGEETARYLMETLQGGLRHYDRFVYIRTGLGQDDYWEREAREEAESRGWEFRSVKGDLRLLQNLCDGAWDEEDFLVLQPGEKLETSYTHGVIRACGRHAEGEEKTKERNEGS